MNLEELSTNVTSMPCFRGSTSSESLVGCVESLENEPDDDSTNSPPKEHSAVVTPNDNLPNSYDSEQNPCLASADSDNALTDASNYEDDKDPRIAPDGVEDSDIYQNISSLGTLPDAMEQSGTDSNNLANDSPSDPDACALDPEETLAGPLLPPHWNAEHSQFATPGSCLNDDYPGAPSSSPTKHENDELFPTSSQELNDDAVESAGIPSSSPPMSSPVTLHYCRSSSPIPMSSPPRASSLTPPTSPARYPDSDADLRPADLDSPKVLAGIDPINIASGETVYEVPGVSGTDAMVGNDMEGEEGHPKTPETTTTSKASTMGEGTLHRKKYQHVIPGPKRATLAAQQVQHKRLSMPFRPLMIVQPPVSAAPNIAPGKMSVPTPSIPKAKGNTPTLLPPVQDKIKDRMAKAAAQFKSPLSKSSREGAVGPLVRPTPTIQALERKLQMLKRANKVRENSEEDALTNLIEKWTEAGREIAWEVWGLVKDNGGSEQQGVGKKRGFDESWAWQDAGESKRAKLEDGERNWGWDIVPVREREGAEDDLSRRTLGTMLLELGIAPETFGWNEEEECFM